MEDEIKSHLKLVNKRIEKLAQESQLKAGFNIKTSRLRMLSELVKEQVESQEILAQSKKK